MLREAILPGFPSKSAVLHKRLDDFLHEERRALGLLQDELLERRETWRRVPSKKVKQFLRSPLCPTALAAVACSTSSAPTHGDTPGGSSPAAELGAGHTLTQHIQKALRLTVNPVQVFKDQDQRLVETLAQEQLLERLERPSPPNLRVHLLQRRGLFFNAQQGKQIGQRVFQDCGPASALSQ